MACAKPTTEAERERLLCDMFVATLLPYVEMADSDSEAEFGTIRAQIRDISRICGMIPENNGSEKDGSKKPKETRKRNQNKDYIVRKRMPRKPVEGDNVIFVTKKCNFKVQLEKCIELLTKGEKEIILHGLGAAIQRTCNLAVQTQLAFPGTHEIEANTDTINITDDLIPTDPTLECDQTYRLQSSIHIRIFRKAVAGANQ